MNLIHRSIWNDQTGTFVAVSETTRSAGKKISSCTAAAGAGERFSLKLLAISLMMACGASGAYAQPTGGVVSAGSATIGGTAGAMTITQTTPNVAINWLSFGVNAGESVRFVQPGSNSVALNRVVGADPSTILGSLSSNGKVFLVNPNGILFGAGASVNVGGLVASTLAISDANFMAAKYRFSGAGTGAVVNQGAISAADGGYVALLGANVSNQGVIAARLGMVALAAGNAVTLDMAGDKLLNITVDQGVVNALVDNGGMIQADGGQVLMTTQAAGSLLANAVNNTGVVQARTIQNVKGTILLMGGMENGTVSVAGTLDASAPNGGDGGFVETSAAHVKVKDNVQVTTAAPLGLTGTWLIDPPDFIIGSGGDIAGSTLGAQLVTTSVTILSSSGVSGTGGDIFVNDAVSWTASGAPTTLTLQAVRDVNVNAAITATKGNLVVCCGRDVNVNAAITTTNGSVLLSAGRDVNVVRSSATPLAPAKNLAGIVTTDGNIEICAARDVVLGNEFDGKPLITLTTGSVIAGQDLANLGVPRGLTLMAGTGGTGPGVAGGTVKIATGTFITTTGPAPVTPTNIFYNPTSYATPTDYSPFFQGDGSPLNQFMLVFPDGGNKTFDGTTGAILAGLKGAPAGVTLVAGPGSTANFDSPDVGVDKAVTFTGYSLGGVDASQYALATSCCGPVVSRTTANITAVTAPGVPVPMPGGNVPPVGSPFGGTSQVPPVLTPSAPPATVPAGYVLTVVPPASLPASVLAVEAPPGPPPVVVPVVPVVAPVEKAPEKYLAPVRKPKPERN
ncbi:filamentous hemagglutinin N-terminal domain-containing protein [Acidovorax carolinensis]|uniref:two-partner secretion domain-containing protein n=1 Tax=Acidovorax carolinensis TaxID=553814 RepID=UPI000B340F20|nr:filamentous hemagglutinin [Acidovorax carolinensis]